jgi:transposase-like protein
MTKKRDRRPASEWEKLISAWRASGESQRAFAEAHGVSASTLASWARKLEASAGKVRRLRERRSTASRPADTFSEVRVRPAPGRAATPPVVEVTTPSGYVLRMTGDVDPASLHALLEEVARC